jgi:hypothetical protein
VPYLKVGEENSGSIDLYYEDHGAALSDPKIKPGTGERNHRLGLLNLLSRDGEAAVRPRALG